MKISYFAGLVEFHGIYLSSNQVDLRRDAADGGKHHRACCCGNLFEEGSCNWGELLSFLSLLCFW